MKLLSIILLLLVALSGCELLNDPEVITQAGEAGEAVGAALAPFFPPIAFWIIIGGGLAKAFGEALKKKGGK